MQRLVVILFGSLLMCCANPKYPAQASDGGGGPRAAELANCPARFSSGRCLSITWEQMPTANSFGSFLFKIFRPNLADSTPVLEEISQAINVLLWMPAMGHGSSPIKVERLDVGTYRASQVFFTMKGQWDVHIQLKDGSDVKDEAIVPIQF